MILKNSGVSDPGVSDNVVVFMLIGSLFNHDDDHNDDLKKKIGFMIKTTAQHVHHAF